MISRDFTWRVAQLSQDPTEGFDDHSRAALKAWIDIPPSVSGPQVAAKTPAHGIYYPIHADDEIRVLLLSPGQPGTSLAGTLLHKGLGFKFPSIPVTDSLGLSNTHRKRETQLGITIEGRAPICYAALSHRWQSSGAPEVMTLNGISKPITDNLAAALQRLRHPRETVILWIDQLCIDQEDEVVDKPAKVARMALVYERAWSAIIWLGDEPDLGAFSMLKR